IQKDDIHIEKIGRRLVTVFLDDQKQRGAADQSRQNWLTCLGSLYEFAKRRYDGIPDSYKAITFDAVPATKVSRSADVTSYP
ncbi:hypothetical protein ACUODJ_57835, partial [Escherichia sp. HC-CC]